MFDFILRPLRRNFGRDKAYYKVVDDMFGFIPNNIELYKLALIHKSASLVLEDGRPINNENLDPEIDPRLNLTLNKAQKRDVKCAMSNTFGFGGHNSTVIFRKI